MEHYSESDIDEMVSLAKQLGSYRKAAREFGCSYQTVIDWCHKRGLHIISNAEKTQNSKKKIIDGISFIFYRGIWRGYYEGKRISLSNYMYIKTHDGQPKPKNLVIAFKDGDKENYSTDNIYFITVSEFMKRQNMKEEIHKKNIKLLDDGRKKLKEIEQAKPWIGARRFHRMWVTRRINDPDGKSFIKATETKRARAKERGFWYSKEVLQHMSEIRIGKRRATILIDRREAEKAAIRRKMGMTI